MHIAGARRAVAEKSEPDRGFAEAALRVGRAGDIGKHRAEMANHGQRAVRRVAMVDVALAGLGRAAGVREILV